ncbi:hypothetical protein RJT34_05254 [Clitoria ternatea]|uniref:J domain-containing protein n=1 Tax=Clitoria ternatea TaxID=43366 RepID=A0AAN9PR44_CLITE
MEKNLNMESEDLRKLRIENRKDETDEFVFGAKQEDSSFMFGDTFKFGAKKEQTGNTRINNKNRVKPKHSSTSPQLDFIVKPKMTHVSPYQDFTLYGIDNTTTTNNECEIESTKAKTNEETSEDNIHGDDEFEFETGSLNSANDEVEVTSDVILDSEQAETSPRSRVEAHEGCDLSSGFTFSASSAEVQSPSMKRHPRKKNWLKIGIGIGNDTYNSAPNVMKVPNSLSPAACSPLSGTGISSLFATGRDQNVSVPHFKTRGSEASKEHEVKKEVASISTSTVAAPDAIEKWRLKGNQAYKIGNLSVAEDCYTQGLNCASKGEASQRCRKALMLCYSNRAATRMSLGRMRNALEDCILAAEIDPNFLRVQLRAANCYLALGEVVDASTCAKRCLQPGAAVCVDQKIAAEASELLQKAQRLSELIDHSDEILQSGTTADAERALEHINEALMICSYSEKLLEMKAEALFMLCKYEEVIQLCDETLGSAEKNSYPLDADCKVTDMDSSQISKSFYFRIWRCSMILKSYFHLGKLEEGLSWLEEQEEKISALNKSGSKALESLIPLAVTVRELLQHKIAGNEAFQAGRHEEAVEHYTASLSCNVESRSFVAVCFGNRAAAYKALGQITDAIADCNLAIALDGGYLKALSRRATLYEMIRDYDQAASDIRRVVSLLIKGDVDNSNQHGISDRSIHYTNDLKHNQIWLLEIEEEARKGTPLDIYLILGIEHSVSSSEIKKAYHKAALRHHPDKAVQSLARSDSGDDQIWKDIVEEVCKDADRLFKIIGEAYAILSDPAKRSQYDSEEEIRNSQKKRLGNSMARKK